MPNNDKAREEEILHSVINKDEPTGNRAVDFFLSGEFAKASNEEVVDPALLLQEIIRGQRSMLANQDKMSQEIAMFRERMVKYDEDALARDEETKKFIEGVLKDSEALKASGETRDRHQAIGAQELQKAIAEARAQMATDKVQFEMELKTMPHVDVVSPGTLETVMQNGQPTMQLYPEVVQIKNKKWVLPPGQVTRVPKVVADVLQSRRESQRMQAELQGAMMKNMEYDKLNEALRSIPEKYREKAPVPEGNN
jgi:hypothetical protein